MKRKILPILFTGATTLFFTHRAAAQQPALVISGYFANPGSSDDNKEFIELTATRDLDFTTPPYSVVLTDAGVGTACSGTGRFSFV